MTIIIMIDDDDDNNNNNNVNFILYLQDFSAILKQKSTEINFNHHSFSSIYGVSLNSLFKRIDSFAFARLFRICYLR